MLMSSITAIAASVAAPAQVPQSDPAMELFWSGCAEGKASVPKDRIAKVDFGVLPRPLQWYYGSVKKLLVVYEISGDQPYYLIYFENPKPKDYEHSKACAVAAKDIEIEHVKHFIAGKFGISDIDRLGCKQSVRWDCQQLFNEFWYTDPAFEYEMYATKRLNNWTVIQLSFLHDRLKERLTELQRRAKSQH